MSNYIYDLPDWPRFRWNQEAISPRLAAVRHKQDRLIGRMQALGFPLRKEAELRTLTLEVLKSSEIEGEILDKEQVRSSVARRLGVDIGALTPEDRKVEGVVEMVLDATRNYDKPLTRERLFAWHASLFPTGYTGMRKIKVGAWRDAPMEVVSGPIGNERVHYEGPPADRIGREMTAFLDWFNRDDGAGNARHHGAPERVPGLPGTLLRRSERDACRCFPDGPILGLPRRRPVQRAAESHAQQTAGRDRR